MRKIITLVLISLLLFTGCSNETLNENEKENNMMNEKDKITSISPNIEEGVDDLPEIKFNIEDINYKVDNIEEINFMTKKQPIKSSEDALFYANQLISEYFTFIKDDYSYYNAIAILIDVENKVWGVSYMKKNEQQSNEDGIEIGGGYNIAFYEENGELVAIWRDE